MSAHFRGKSALRCLITCCGAAPALSTIEALRKQKKYEVCIIASDIRKESIGEFVGDEFEVVPSFHDKNFCGLMIQLCKKKNIDYVFPILDLELEKWASIKNELQVSGTYVFVNPIDCINNANDKCLSWRKCIMNGVNHPKSFVAKDRSHIIDNLPVIAKPFVGLGTQGVVKIHSKSQLDSYLEKYDLGETLFSEILSGEEYTVDVAYDFITNACIAVVPKERLEVRNGQAVRSITRNNADVIHFAQTVSKVFGVKYFCNIQCMRDSNGKFSLVEINPRFPASLNLTVAAGPNIPLHMIEISRNEFQRNPHQIYDYMPFTPNLLLIRCHKNYYLSMENDKEHFTGDPGFLSKTHKSQAKPFLKHLIHFFAFVFLAQYILNSKFFVDGIYFGIEGGHGLKIPKVDELYEMRRYYVEDGVPYKGIHIYLRHAAVLRAAMETASFEKDNTMNVLNVGSGYGVFDRLLPRKGINFLGIEKSEDAYTYASKWANEINDIMENDAFKYYHGSHFQLCNASSEMFKPGKFDVVIISEVLEHVDSNLLEDFVRRLDCVLKTGGKIVITVPNRMHLRNMARDFFRMNLVKMDADHVTRVERNPPSFEYTLGEFEKEIIRGTKFKFYKQIYFRSELVYFPMEKVLSALIAPYSIVRQWIVTLFPSVGCHFLFVLEKVK